MLESTRVVAIPPISLRLKVKLACVHNLVGNDYLVLGEVFLGVLNAYLPRPLSAGLRIVGERSAIRARALTILGHCVAGGCPSPTIPGVVYCRRRDVVPGSLMSEDWLVLLV